MEVGVLGFIVAGLVVGFIVGMTGVGGGSLMTPILLWFGINPATAVGTDLLYAAITKSGGIFVHQKNKNIDWSITGWLTLGSVPAAALTLWLLSTLHTDTQAMNAIIRQALGFVLLLTALAILFKQQLLAFAHKHAGDHYHLSGRSLNALTVVTGIMLGIMVGHPDLDWRRRPGHGGVVSALSVPGHQAPGRHRDRPRRTPDPGGRSRPCRHG